MAVPIVRASERATFKRCPARWWWAWREGLVPVGEPAGPLWFGQGVHIALAEWYCGPGKKRGREPAETWKEFAGDTLNYVKTLAVTTDEIVDRFEDATALGVAMLEGYRRLYGRDEHMEVIAPEQTFAIELPWPANGLYRRKGVMAIHAGTFDLPYRDAGTGWLMLGEHKTAKSISTRHLNLDDQGGTYWAVANQTLRAMGLIKPLEKLRGIQYNFLRKAMPDDRPRDEEGYATNKPLKADYLAQLADLLPDQKLAAKAKLEELQAVAALHNRIVIGERSKVQPPPLFLRHTVHRTSRERRSQLARLQADAIHMQLFRDGKLPISKTPTRDCGWDCSFYDMCELQERGGDWESLKSVAYVVQDPYADHRKSAEE